MSLLQITQNFGRKESMLGIGNITSMKYILLGILLISNAYFLRVLEKSEW